MSIGKIFKMHAGAKTRVRKGAESIIGNNTSMNSNNMIACHERVVIGDNCIVGAGSVIKGEFPAGTVIVQKRETEICNGVI